MADNMDGLRRETQIDILYLKLTAEFHGLCYIPLSVLFGNIHWFGLHCNRGFVLLNPSLLAIPGPTDVTPLVLPTNVFHRQLARHHALACLVNLENFNFLHIGTVICLMYVQTHSISSLVL